MWGNYSSKPEEEIVVNVFETSFSIFQNGNNLNIKMLESETQECSIRARQKKSVEYSSEIKIATKQISNLHIVPCLSDRPLILKEIPLFKVMPSAKITLFAFCPIGIQLYSSSIKPENILLEKMSSELSQAWLGEPDAGVLGYSLLNSVDLKRDSDLFQPWTACCTISFFNESKKPVEPNKLSIDTTQLKMYENEQKLYTSNINIHYKDENAPFDVEYSHNKPSQFPKAKLVADARNPVGTNLFYKSYNFLKSITQIR